MKAQELSGLHMGKKISVSTDVIAVAGNLLRVTHTEGIDKVDLMFQGGLRISVVRNADVEVLE